MLMHLMSAIRNNYVYTLKYSFSTGNASVIYDTRATNYGVTALPSVMVHNNAYALNYVAST